MAAGRKSAIVFLIIEFAILVPYIVAFSLDTWAIIMENEAAEPMKSNMGLWWGCGYNHDMQFVDVGNCFSMLEAGVPAWLRAVQGFAILGIFFGVVCLILTSVMAWGPCDPNMMFKLFLPVWYFAGFSMLLAIVIFGASMPPYERIIPEYGVPGRSKLIIQKFWTAFIIESIASCAWNAFGFVFLCAICCT